MQMKKSKNIYEILWLCFHQNQCFKLININFKTKMSLQRQKNLTWNNYNNN